MIYQMNNNQSFTLSLLGGYLRVGTFRKCIGFFAFIFILGLTSGYSQTIQSIDKMMNDMNSSEKDALVKSVYGNENVCLIKNGDVVTDLNSETLIKTVRLSSLSDLAAMTSLSDHYGTIEAINVKVAGSGSIQFDESILSQLTELKYVIVVFDQFMSESEIRSKFTQSLDEYDWIILYSVPE